MNAILLIIGDEVLSGTTIDTNSSFISNQLKAIGIKVSKIFTLPDHIDEIIHSLETAFKTADLVIATGGLGPTKDDKTKNAFAEFFDDDIVFDEGVFQHLKLYLDKKGRLDILDQNRSQAEVFASGKVFLNDYGTAPGLLISKGHKTAICLPGVPYEVKPLMKEKVIHYLSNRFSREAIVEQTISVVGIPESILSLRIEDWELALPEHFNISYLPVGTRIKLKISAMGLDFLALQKELAYQIDLLCPLIEDFIISKDGDSIEEILKNLLIKNQLSIATAESCTGGELSRLITSVSGSSAYFMGGVCTYQTRIKTEILQVSEQLIQDKTVVSEEVAAAMSLGCQQLFNTDIAVSTTGVAGPASDDFNTEVGLAYYSVRIKDEVRNFKVFLPHLERKDFIEFLSQKVLQSVVECLV